ncbi:MAG: DUF433 domain-containing protein [Phycisphaerae bacterium]
MKLSTQSHSAADGKIVSSPGVLGGKPVFAGTRVPVSAMFDYLADNLTLEYFLESFPAVSRDQAVAALRHGQERIEQELFA